MRHRTRQPTPLLALALALMVTGPLLWASASTRGAQSVATSIAVASPVALPDATKPVGGEAGFPLPKEIDVLAGASVAVRLPVDAPLVLTLERITIPTGSALDLAVIGGPLGFIVEVGTATFIDDLGLEAPYAAGSAEVFPAAAVTDIQNAGPQDLTLILFHLGAPTDSGGRGRAGQASPEAGEATVTREVLVAGEAVFRASAGTMFLASTSWQPGADLGMHRALGPVALYMDSGQLGVSRATGVESVLREGQGVVLPLDIERRERNVGAEPVTVVMAGLTAAGDFLVPVPTATPPPTQTPSATATSEPTTIPLPSATRASTATPTAVPTAATSPVPTVTTLPTRPPLPVPPTATRPPAATPVTTAATPVSEPGEAPASLGDGLADGPPEDLESSQASIAALLPDEPEAPGGLIVIDERRRTIEEVAGGYADPEEAVLFFTGVDWRGNVTRTFGPPVGGSLSAEATSSVYVSIHRFANTDGARLSVDYAVGDDRDDDTEVDAADLGDYARAVTRTTDDGTLVTVHVQAATLYLRVSAFSVAGDPTDTAVDLVDAILDER